MIYMCAMYRGNRMKKWLGTALCMLAAGCCCIESPDGREDVKSFFRDCTVQDESMQLKVSIHETDSVHLASVRIVAPSVKEDLFVPLKWVAPFKAGFVYRGERISCRRCHFLFSVKSESAEVGRWYGMMGDVEFEDEDSLVKYLDSYIDSRHEFRRDLLTEDGVLCLLHLGGRGNLSGMEICRLRLRGAPAPRRILEKWAVKRCAEPEI